MSIKRIELKSYYTDKELKKEIGKFFDDSDYTEINEDCDCYFEGKFVCKLRKGVINSDIVKNYDNILFGYNNNRGRSAGKVDPEKVKLLDKRGFKLISDYKYARINKDNSVSGYHLSNPVRSNIVGYFDYITYKTGENDKKIKSRKIKITANTNEKSLDELEELTKLNDKLYKQLLPEQYKKNKNLLEKVGYKEYLYNDTLFSTITCNTDFRTALHQDANNFTGTAVMSVIDPSENKFKGGELLFPKYKVKINMKDGDFIVFYNKEFHTNNKIIGGNRHSFVFYIRENIYRMYNETKSNFGEEIERLYTRDLFINFDNKCIILDPKSKPNYNKYKKEIINYSKENNIPIYRLGDKMFYKNRKFGEDGEIRYINKKHYHKFNNCILLDAILNQKKKKISSVATKPKKKLIKLATIKKKITLDDLSSDEESESEYYSDSDSDSEVEEIIEEDIIEEIDYVIAIRSYKRVKEIGKKTLRVLKENNIPDNKIYIFCAEEEIEEYRNEYPQHHICNGGDKGVAYCGNLIIDYFDKGKYIIEMDDDVRRIYTCNSTSRKDDVDYKLENLIRRGYKLMKENNTILWGTYSVNNSYFMWNNKEEVSNGLRFCIGRVFGFINDSDIKVKDDCREDYERTIKTFIKYGSVIRFNKISVVADTFTGKGGLNEIRTKQKMQDSVDYMVNTYPEYCANKKVSKSRKYPEIRLKLIPKRTEPIKTLSPEEKKVLLYSRHTREKKIKELEILKLKMKKLEKEINELK
jgi:hypothetical protein